MGNKRIRIKLFSDEDKYYSVLYLSDYDNIVGKFSGLGESTISYDDSVTKMVNDLRVNMNSSKLLSKKISNITPNDIEISLSTDECHISKQDIINRLYGK